ncbi:MAG: hypothetical protein US83_C0001G0054 [Candidatus Falkowbacteria bacterium GW2011_GWC2_38_22]|uniref:Uncharacterized protein n=1 Tax=Candidatus Falkowbacteria bacterium GW2011_GWE1_38_31 TaxID=1618638 RepID=A0A0G0K667_9BACT|nr:MAG: hypothetical protein US73_C0004G0074 [Candidatus Falkowbacteria bacterium GW2011_GWF2_38_1205]KKQ62120.1 MAG: hypothetical protein US83_C0001G0054 [Candidatus Falkowbacteria bacterium GW2011_GWC2_38_22]KKQ64270.1 MAG: hypothetical protein US84_C0001G0054 [Candidatus Falkowbacteria bacterium GW2011_GWF1_38_22]KKQ66247.1 MAG: hypothetical protein US87_C0002G0054 [Candidatus Falkowbacteria bacterium GW2011_GWE2_38_254]KKQ70975.1 MAG: hypothetical protein US91_C0002G0054 [Candidatus Falkowb
MENEKSNKIKEEVSSKRTPTNEKELVKEWTIDDFVLDDGPDEDDY